MNKKANFLKRLNAQLIIIGAFHLFCFAGTAKENSTTKLKVLFIGNSYTSTNDLPSLINELAKSTGDEIIYSSNTPGGYTFEAHYADATTNALINQGGWDYVVLQEQSQRPAFSDYQVAWQVYPYAKKLDSLVKISSPCAKTVFYMTWGKKYGDPDLCRYLPALCTYEGMDDLLQLRYTNMADSNQSVLCPVAIVWRSLINNYPALELYNGDGSHPSLAGSYAVACTFYSVFFKKDPVLCTYTSSLNTGDAVIIQNVSKAVVYDAIENWYAAYPNVKAAYTSSFESNCVLFSNTSENAESFGWDFGDGTSSVLKNPLHKYTTNGSYKVSLIADKCKDADTIVQTISIETTSIEYSLSEKKITLYPNPANDVIFLESPGLGTEIVITNSTGQILKHFTSENDSFISFDIKSLDSGVYFINIQSESESKCIKFYKK